MTDQTQQTPAQRAIGDFSPKLITLTDDILFGDVWERSGLSKRDRSLATIATRSAPPSNFPTTCNEAWTTASPKTRSSNSSLTWPSTLDGRARCLQ